MDVGVEVMDVEVGVEARNMDRGWLLGVIEVLQM